MKEYIKYAAPFSFPFNNSCTPFSIQLNKGKFKLEAWGASGGNEYGGRGAYATGIINLIEQTQFFIFVGGEGENISKTMTNPKGGCNGGGHGGMPSRDDFYNGAGGGGSTDIRLNLSTIYDSRILVAAGGGGAGGNGVQATEKPQKGGFGGAETGEKTAEERKIVPTQEFGFMKLQGQNGRDAGQYYFSGSEGSGGAGGGYFGGYAVQTEGEYSVTGGSGGSSFANKQILTDVKLNSGDMGFLSPLGNLETGHSGNGYFRIAPLNVIGFKTCKEHMICNQRLISLIFSSFVLWK